MSKKIRKLALDGDVLAVQVLVEFNEKDRALLKQALDALVYHSAYTHPIQRTNDTIEALMDRLN